MKRIALILLAIVAVAMLGWRFAASGVHETEPSSSSHSSYQPPSTTNNDGTEVFQRAFWKRPTADDEIRHAERREWKDADCISRWQWFIEVKASSQLVKHLITDNAFSLSPSTKLPSLEKPPAWFVGDKTSTRILRAPGGGMTLLFDEKAGVVLATDSGGGFRKGLPEPAKPVAQNNAPSSRLPNSSPPTKP